MKLQAAIFCQSERHLAICYVSSSNRQKLFPFLLVTLPIFVGDIYIYIYIYVYIFKSLECEDSDEYDAHADDAVAVAPSAWRILLGWLSGDFWDFGSLSE